MNVSASVRFIFDVSQREFSQIVKALETQGAEGIQLATELRAYRAKHFESIARRFTEHMQLTSNEGGADE